MKIADKTKEQLVEDLEALRSRIAELERTEAKCKQREEAIRKLEEEKLSILNSMSERVVYQNQQHRILWANKAAAEAADLAREQLVGCYCYEIWQKRSEPCDDCPVAKARETGKPQASEMTTPEGKVLFIQGYPIRDTDDRIVGLVEVALEITERKQVEEALRKGERKYELLFESTLDGMFVLDAETMKIVLANQAAVDIYGLNSVEDAIGVNLLDFVPPEERERVLRIIVKDMFENDLRQVNEFRGITRDGREIWVSAVGTRTEYRGKLAGLISFSDITERKQAEEALQKSREELRKMFESVTDGISVVDLNGIITDVNQRTVEMHGFSSKDEILGKNALELVAPRDHKRAAINMRQTLKEGLSREVEYTLLKADGSEFPGELSTSVLKDAAGNLVGHITIVRDITERKEAEETLQAERNKLQSVIDALEDGLTIQDRDYNILYQSKPSQTTAGYHPGEKCYRVYEGRDKVCDGCPAEKAFRDGKSHTSERRIVTLSGEVLFLENTASPIRDAEGKIVSCLEITRDVTERKRAEQVLRESETKHRTIFENVSDVVVRLNKRGKIIDANKRIEDYFGYKPDEIIGKNFAKLGVLSPKDLPKAVKLFSAGIKGKSSPLIELEVKRKDGSTAHLEANTTLIKENGKIEGTIAIIRDITERKQVEEALREAEEEKSALLEEAPIAIINTDLKGKITYVNKRFESESGYSRGEIVGKNGLQLDWLPAGTIRYLTKRMVARLRGRPGKHWATQFKCKDGRWIWVEIEGKVLRKLGVPAGFQIIARNITERKQVEEALRIEKNKLQSVIDALEYGLTIQDRDYNILYKNELLKTESGDRLGEKCYRAYEGRDKPCDDCPVEKAFRDGKSHTSERKIVSPSGEALCLENTANPIRDAKGKIVSCLEITRDITERKEMEEALQKNRGELRTMFESVTDGISVVDLNGIITEVNQRAVEMHGFSSKKEMVGKNAFELVAPCDHKRVAANMRKALTQGVIKGVEYTLLKADGSEFPGELSTSVLKDASGKAIGHITILRDITERKEAEEREKELQQELNLASRLAAVGELAAGVAHEMNNPLTGIMGFSERLLRKSGDDDAKKDLEIVHSEAQRLAKVVKNLLIFARQREPAKEYADINDIMQRTLELRAYELKSSNIEVALDLTANLPQIMVDFHQIQEVFLNIILNAEQVMAEASGGGKLTIKTRQIKDYIRISFTDDGPGIPVEHLDRVFNPFFTTKGERGGTGLGLSVCHGIVTEHGGRIYARSKPGSGATFLVDLPLTSRKIGESQIAKAQLAL